MSQWKKNILFLLVEPRESGNIGASARAMKNMGFSRLGLVSPPDPLKDDARWFACHALDVLDNALRFRALSEAIADVSVVVGTARRIGRRRGLQLSVEDGARRIVEIAQTSQVAILFGREDRGLYREEIEHCGFTIHITAHRTQPSLNLSQAVLLVAYELGRASQSLCIPTDDEISVRKAELVSQRELAFLFERITAVLRLLEYLPKGDRDLERKIMMNLKYFIGRAGMTRWELNMLHGICTRIEEKIATNRLPVLNK
jgi:TrmH family RNA methyltransferase